MYDEAAAMPLRFSQFPPTFQIPFGTAMAFLLVANLVFYRMLYEVNRARDPSKRIGVSFVSFRFFEVMVLHKELFPGSRKYILLYGSAILGFAIFVSSIVWAVRFASR